MEKQLIGTVFYRQGGDAFDGVFVPEGYEFNSDYSWGQKEQLKHAYGCREKKLFQPVYEKPNDKYKYNVEELCWEKTQLCQLRWFSHFAFKAVTDKSGNKYFMVIHALGYEFEEYYFSRLGFPEKTSNYMDKMRGVFQCKLYKTKIFKDMF